MKYRVRFYREYEIETDATEEALFRARVLLARDLGDQKIGEGFTYEIHFKIDQEEKVFRGGV